MEDKRLGLREGGTALVEAEFLRPEPHRKGNNYSDRRTDGKGRHMVREEEMRHPAVCLRCWVLIAGGYPAPCPPSPTHALSPKRLRTGQGASCPP